MLENQSASIHGGFRQNHLLRGPNIPLPTLIMVAPSAIAASRSSDIPIDRVSIAGTAPALHNEGYYPVNKKGEGEFHGWNPKFVASMNKFFKAPDATQVRANFWSGPKVDMVKQPDGF